MITCSIHATEVASTHTAVEFAYRLLTEENPRFKAILDNVILLLEPSQNPDGVDIVTRWYRKTRGTPYDGTSPPELYHHYVGHDDNRDWYIFTQPETRNTATPGKPVASGDRIRRASDGAQCSAPFRSAVDGSGGSEHRSDSGQHLQHDRDRRGHRSLRGRKNRHRD